MQIILDATQQSFYQNNRWLVLEEMWEREALLSACRLITLGKPLPPKERLLLGRDRFRNDPRFAKLFYSRRLAQLMKQLLNRAPLRFLLDQVIDMDSWPLFSGAIPLGLSSMFSLHGIVAALLIALEEEVGAEEAHSTSQLEEKIHLPKRVGDLLCFQGDRLFKVAPLLSKSDRSFQLVLVGAIDARYSPSPFDPLASYLKQFSYGSGDRLRDETHPPIT